ncbi:nitrogen fixation protein NifZ [Nitrospirillum sp. BR 11163]|uniref:nitrogen fixation protein NifZ n=1 Tax=Nitrospirillum sp. BR 11163 TaxID=3104323 RepID=UPI002AFDCCAF|nr:nitrogen fixation protein NifZ [Nitrospirillum sp. BR 11163]MEA1675931.1 nitrogen fixation protein NifZ [Nitrospirillum sp. BR 11163]
MIEPRQPLYRWGQRMRTVIDLVNDGTYPDAPADALLEPAGTMGEIVQVGAHVESGTPVYLVEFADQRVIGCLEEEIVPV